MSGSIFRRGGQKAEAHGTPSEQQFSGAHLETKLAVLQKSYSAPLTAYVLTVFQRSSISKLVQLVYERSCLYRATQSLAVWRPEHDAAEVTIERGNVLQRMGKSPLYLYPGLQLGCHFLPWLWFRHAGPLVCHAKYAICPQVTGIIGSCTCMWRKLCKPSAVSQSCRLSVAAIVLTEANALSGIW